MEWQAEGLVIGVRRHGETSVILDLFTALRGRHVGMVLGGRSRKLRPVLQPGNGVLATWRARLEEQMGTFAIEPTRLRAGEIMRKAGALHALNHLCGLARLLPERDPHPDLHDRFAELMDGLDDSRTLAPRLVDFELALLADLGFGLDLTCCAATGSREDLAYVSPRTGRAVSRVAGEPYRDRIMALPAFLIEEADETRFSRVTTAEALSGFRLTEYFLKRDIFEPRGLLMPEARRAYLATLSSESP